MADQPNGLFSLSDADLENLRRLSAQFGPSAEDQANAKKQAIMALGFGLLSGRKGNELATIGNAGQNALLQYQNDLSRFGQQRGQGLTQGMQVLSMAKQFQNTAMQDELTKKIMTAMGGSGQPQSAPSGPPPVAPDFGASVAPPPGTPPAPMPQQQNASQAPSGAPSWATPQLEALAAVSGRKDLADVIHRQMNLTQGPGGTLMRNNTVVGQVIPNYGMILDGKPQPLPKEVTDALVSYEGATARAKGQAAAESELVTVPGPTPQSKSRMIPKAQYLAELKAQQSAPQEGAYGNRAELTSSLSPDQQRIAAQDFARNAPAAQVPPSSIRTPAELPQIGQVPSPTMVRQAETDIATHAAATQEVNKGAIGQIDKGYEIANQAAIQTIPLIHEARSMLDSGKVITGKGANFATDFGGWLAQAGFKSANDPVANTQAFAATQARQVLTTIKSLGSGSGISDQDREYAKQIVAGDIRITEDAIRKLMDISERAQRVSIASHNKRVDTASKVLNNPDLQTLYQVNMPEPYMRKSTPSGSGIPLTPAEEQELVNLRKALER